MQQQVDAVAQLVADYYGYSSMSNSSQPRIASRTKKAQPFYGFDWKAFVAKGSQLSFDSNDRSYI